MDATNPPTLHAPVLGQFLLMQSVLCNLPNEASIFSFVCQGLLDLPGVAEAKVAEAPRGPPDPSRVCYPLQLGGSRHGELCLRLSDPSVFAPYEPYLRNFCFMLAVILEERHQRRLNEQHTVRLEQRVAERTADLEGARKAEAGSRLEALRMMEEAVLAQRRAEETAAALQHEALERKRAQQDQARLVAILEATPDFVGFADAKDTHILYINPAGRSMVGIGAEEDVTRLKIADVHPEWTNRLFREEILPTAARDGVWTGEFDFLSRDGREIPVISVVLAHRSPGGELERFSTISRDITERKLAEEALRESERRLRSVMTAAPLVLWNLDRAGTILLSEGKALPHLGLRAGELVGQSVFEFSKDNPEALALIRRGLAGEEFSAEILSGGRHWSNYYAPRRDEAGNVVGLVGVSVDITERKQAEEALQASEERLRQAEKMTAIGQLAGGVAHDFNNQLASIMGYADLLADLVEEGNHKRYARNIVVSAQRAAELTRQLLAFSRKGKYLSVPVAVHSLLGEVVMVLERSIDKRVRIVQRLEAAHSVVRGDPGQLQNALLNVALNARDAMPQGGELRFETEVAALDEEYCRNSPCEMAPGEYLCISISDTGCGMSDEVKQHLFEPFFTTKPPGQGTGMGLASLYGTVRSHHGGIFVYSEVGRGTMVRILLPLGPETAAPAPARTVLAPARGTARILLVEDEKLVREMAADVLRSLGYLVVTCADGREAVEYFRAKGSELDLVILDMVMPEMGGRDTFLAMRRINPRVRALLSSGYSLDGEAQGILNEGVLGFIGKPFRRSELARSVAEALQARGASR